MIFFIIKNNLFSRSFSRLLSSSVLCEMNFDEFIGTKLEFIGTKKWLFTHILKCNYNYYVNIILISQFKQMMMSLDTEDDSDTEETKREDQSGYSPVDNEGDFPAGEADEQQKHTEMMKQNEDEKVKNERGEINDKDIGQQVITEIQDEKPQKSGVVPQSKELSSLPGLNLDIPIIPIKV